MTGLVARVREDRRLQAALAILLVLTLAFAWWTVSPLFLTTTASEALPTARPPAATTSAAPTGTAAASATPSPAPTDPVVLARGELQYIDELHRGSGPVLLLSVGTTHYVRFEEVVIQNGPDLHVYLARGTGGAYDGERDLYLGTLKATNGSFNYELPADIDLAEYRSVVVWCRAFSVLFTWADLEEAAP